MNIWYMSGAAGLAAAKRRRGGAGNSPGGPESRPSLARPPPAPQGGQPRFDILGIVTDHERRLRLIEAGSPDDQSSTQDLSNHVVNDVVDHSVRSGTDSAEIEDLRKQVDDLRALLSKVQTFAMETNTKLLRLQISRMSVSDAGETESTSNQHEETALVVTEKDDSKDKAKPKKGNGKKIEET